MPLSGLASLHHIEYVKKQRSEQGVWLERCWGLGLNDGTLSYLNLPLRQGTKSPQRRCIMTYSNGVNKKKQISRLPPFYTAVFISSILFRHQLETKGAGLDWQESWQSPLLIRGNSVRGHSLMKRWQGEDDMWKLWFGVTLKGKTNCTYCTI